MSNVYLTTFQTQSVIICINGNWTLSNCEYNPCVTNRCNGHGNCQTNGLTYHCQCESCYTGLIVKI